MIPYGRQNITEDDIEQVANVLRSDFLTQGLKTPEFEREIAGYCMASYAVAVNSATSALHIACLALDLRKDDWLWTTPNTFVASANCALYCGARIDFVDIDPCTYNMCPHRLEAKLVEAKKSGKLPKIVVPVHLTGYPCEMDAIHRLSQKYGFRVIEDASHAIGGRYWGEPIGSSRYSDITIFSFHPVKIITTGEGGIVVTNNKELFDKMALLRSHGITRDPSMMNHEPDGPWYYQQIALGFNYRMTEMQAALGISQLKRIDSFINKRHQLAELYDKLLVDLPLQLPRHTDMNHYSALHLYVVRTTGLDNEEHRRLFQLLREKGIGVNLHYIPVHTQPYYRQFGFMLGDFPNAEHYYREALSLPIFPDLTEEVLLHVVKVLKEAMN